MTIYINSLSGDDATGSGTSGDPYETLAHAFDQSSADDTIICQDSTATYTFTNDTFDHNITIQGESDDASGAVFDGGGAAIGWSISATVNIKYITFQDIINKGRDEGVFIPTTNNNLSFTNCIFHNLQSGNNGSHVGRGGIICGTALDPTLSNVDITLERCLIYDIREIAAGGNSGFFAFRLSNDDINVILTNTTFFNSESGATRIDDFINNVNMAGTNSLTITNCIFRDASGTDLTLSDDEGEWDTLDSTYSCYNNITFAGTGTGDITSDPLYVDEDNDNFKLRPSSPAIDTGTLI